MTNYLSWNQNTLTDLTPKNVSKMYADGYVFTRLGKGVMQQTRSIRIDLSHFNMTSENRRILKKGEFDMAAVPLPMNGYDFSIGKLAKDFYTKKFGDKVMSAQKIKEMLTDEKRSNFTTLLMYKTGLSGTPFEPHALGFSICYINEDIIHYSFPFYDLDKASKDMGLIMMTMLIKHAKEANFKYVYLGSLQRPTDTYKLQFGGLEWFDGKAWQTDLGEVKKILASAKI